MIYSLTVINKTLRFVSIQTIFQELQIEMMSKMMIFSAYDVNLYLLKKTKSEKSFESGMLFMDIRNTR